MDDEPIAVTKASPLPTRTAIRRALSLCPGASASQVMAITGRGWGALDHALHSMVASGEVRQLEWGSRRAYFLTGSGAGAAFGLRGAALRFFEAVNRLGGGTAQEVATATGMGASDVSRTGARLQKMGFIAVVRHGGVVYYLPTQYHQQPTPAPHSPGRSTGGRSTQ